MSETAEEKANINPNRPSLITILFITSLFGMTGGSLIAPALPGMAGPLGVSEEQVGLILASYTFACAVSIPFIGCLLDRWGRKTVLIPCLIGNGLAGIACFLTSDFYLILIFRFIQGVFISALIPTVMTLIGDLYDDMQRVQIMGGMSAVNSIGSVCTPLIGGGLAYLQWNYPFLFFALTLPLALLAAWIIPQTKSHESSTIMDYLRLLGTALKQKKTINVNLMSFIMFFLIYTVIVYIPVLLQNEFGFSSLSAGIALAVQGLAVAVLSLNAKNLRLKFKLRYILSSGFILITISFLVFSMTRSIVAVFCLLFVFGSGLGLIMPQLNVLITERSEPQYRGGVVAVFNSLKFVGQTASPALLGLVFPYVNIFGVFFIGSVIAISTGIYTYFTE